MTKNVVLKNMFESLFTALPQNHSTALLSENYRRQCALYERLLNMSERENELVCGRCLIALSRSLAFDTIDSKSFSAVKNELEILRTIFIPTEKRPSKKQIEKLVHSRIEKLKSTASDEAIDAVLFLYLSLR